MGIEGAPRPPVIWEPNPRQLEFLACADYEVLFGGAAGGGKSDALLVDAMGGPFAGVQNKNWRAILFRRTFPELQDLIDRSHELYPIAVPGAKYNKVDHVWTFPSGAKIYLGHLQHDADRFKYRGRNFNYIAFDELTLWATNKCWLYLQSRNRSADRSLPCYMRATTNPDGPGQKWVMDHWGISEDGKGTRLVQLREVEEPGEKPDEWVLVQRERARTFIPAKLTDNKHLRGTGYREILLDLPPEQRDALLYGYWRGNAIEGAYYQAQMAKVRSENRITRVPWLVDAPVNTFWDLGFNDTTAIWFHQYAALSHRFPLAYENSGESLSHFANYLQQVAKDNGIVYGTHYLPHDADSHSLQTGKTAKQILQELLPGHRFEVLPRTPNVVIGIQQTRAAFPHVWMDREGCADGIAALDAYRKRWNRRVEAWMDEPEHDRFSNYADAFRQFGEGYFPRHRHRNTVTAEAREGRPRRRRDGPRNWRSA